MLKRFFFKSIYKFRSLFYRPFIKLEKPLQFKNILIFGKGESLKYYLNYFSIKRKNIDLVILVNFEKNDLKSYNLKDYINDIPIVILGNITEPLLNLNNIINLKFYDVMVQRIYPDIHNKKSRTGLAMLRQNYKLDSYSLKVKYLNRYIENFLKNNVNVKKNSNCGLIGIILGCSYKPKNIYIFGIDFYESEYFNKKLLENMDTKEKKRLIGMKENFKKMFKIIIQKHNLIQFKIFTKARINNSYKNLVIYKV